MTIYTGGGAMALAATRYQHIVLDDRGVSLIADTTMKVTELVVAQRAYGWSPAELQFQFPHLTLGQIHSALAYYWDHQDTLDAEIARGLELVDAMQRGMPVAPAIAQLKRERQR
jgi:uncharacterized protein (DUF433 family)